MWLVQKKNHLKCAILIFTVFADAQILKRSRTLTNVTALKVTFTIELSIRYSDFIEEFVMYK